MDASSQEMLALWLVALTFGFVQSVTFPKFVKPQSKSKYSLPHEILKDGEDELGVCLRSRDQLLPCISTGAARTLESAKSMPELDLGSGLTLVEEFDLDMDDDIEEPEDDRREMNSFFNSLGSFVRDRYLLWDMNFLYPGLMMRVGSAKRGVMNFLIDQRKATDDRSLSTGHLLLKRTLLPILLGFKIKVATLLPLLFAGLILLIKKALIFSKLSLLLSGLSFLKGNGYSSNSHDNSFTNFGGSSGGLYGGSGGLGTFGPTKHVIIDRPVNWFEREVHDPLTSKTQA